MLPARVTPRRWPSGKRQEVPNHTVPVRENVAHVQGIASVTTGPPLTAPGLEHEKKSVINLPVLPKTQQASTMDCPGLPDADWPVSTLTRNSAQSLYPVLTLLQHPVPHALR